MVKVKCHRKINGRILNATISYTSSDKYYVSICYEVEDYIPLPRTRNIIGLDLGLTDFLVDNTGNHIKNIKVLKQYEDKITMYQRRLNRKQHSRFQGDKTQKSNNYRKYTIKLAKLHEKIRNIRRDFLHKLSTKIINENQVIIAEDLSIKNMLKNHKLARSISDTGWYIFCNMLKYKSEMYGRIFHQVNTWFASTKICSQCGVKNPEINKLSIRNWECPKCGTVHQRDHNAANNILQQGLKDLNIC